MRTLLLPVPLLLLALVARAEDKKPAVSPLAAGQTKVFEAIVIQVQGTAQARTKPDQPWKQLAINDKLAPGVVVRTGRESHVTLRVGPNATMLIEHQTRIAIPEIAQDGDKLKTRVSMAFGQTDVRVDRIGLTNDFEVATPTATLAVRGTVFRISWDAVSGARMVGVQGNKLRAIELQYLEGVRAYLSHADGSNDTYKLPAIASYYETYILPLEGAVSEGEIDDPTQQSTDALTDPKNQTNIEIAQKQRASDGRSQSPNGPGTNNPNNPPTGQ
ncbi:MAG TPA: FecR domain-containing protein [Planctomycetota bacterium]|nr:FecR domain-containing protein [Planctomycetota bacterium]